MANTVNITSAYSTNSVVERDFTSAQLGRQKELLTEFRAVVAPVVPLGTLTEAIKVESAVGNNVPVNTSDTAVVTPITNVAGTELLEKAETPRQDLDVTTEHAPIDAPALDKENPVDMERTAELVSTAEADKTEEE